MSEKKKVVVKVKKRKFNIKKFLIFILILYIIYYMVSSILEGNLKNIYIIQNNNNFLSDYEVIKRTNLEGYPDFIRINKGKIKKELLNDDYIENVEVKKKFYNEIIIEINYYDLLCLYQNKVLLSNGKLVDNIYQVTNLPYLETELNKDMLLKLSKALGKLDKGVLLKISEIQYAMVDVDKERFLLYMNDGNYVYVTLSKIDLMNKYDEIYNKLGDKKGILNLDSGNSFEIRE